MYPQNMPAPAPGSQYIKEGPRPQAFPSLEGAEDRKQSHTV